MFFFDIRYMIFMLPAILLMLAAQAYVSFAYQRWSKIMARSRLSGMQAVQRLIYSAGLQGIRIEPVSGQLTDHYDPQTKVLRLSGGVYEGQSVASLAIAAHELGHAMQDHEGYFPLRFRAALVPAVNIGSYLGWILIFIGIILGMTNLAWLGVLVFSGGALFALATLPVELNASARAKKLLTDSGIVVDEEEIKGINNVLNAAALTYLAGLVTAFMQLLYYVSLVTGMGRREE
jgi:hypothetical protein